MHSRVDGVCILDGVHTDWFSVSKTCCGAYTYEYTHAIASHAVFYGLRYNTSASVYPKNRRCIGPIGSGVQYVVEHL